MMGASSDDVLKVSLAFAALAGGLSIAYHYAVYIPAHDERAAVDKAHQIQQQFGAQSAEKSAQLARAREQQIAYKVCLSNAQMDYSSRWNESCKVIADKSTKARVSCLNSGSEAAWCFAQYPIEPGGSCQLPAAQASDYGADLKSSKQRCLDEAKSGLAALISQ